MKIDFSQKFTDLNGNALKDKVEGELSLKDICIDALLAVDKNNPTEAKDKLARYDLALALNKEEKDSLSAEEIVMLKDLIGKYFTTLVVGQAFPMLDSD